MKKKVEPLREVIELEHIVNLPTTVPVFRAQDVNQQLGTADLFEEDKVICSNLYLTEELDTQKIKLNIAGIVLERQGNKITKFKITNVSVMNL